MPYKRKTPPASRVSQVQRAADQVQRDPEEAQARLQAAVAPGQTVSMADVSMLMDKFTAIIQTTLVAQQQQIEDLKQANRKPGAKTPWTEEDLERLNDQEAFLRRFWASEPQVPCYVKPSIEEERIRQSLKARSYPPRPFQVNGVTYMLTVGDDTVRVPQSIAERIKEAQNGYRPVHDDAPQDLESIPRPPRSYLAAEAGRPGNLGQGSIPVHNLPAEPLGLVAR